MVVSGCFAKRQLEASKFLFIDALEIISLETLEMTQRLRYSRRLLKRASTLSKGLGWGLDHGEIHLALATVDLAIWAHDIHQEGEEEELLEEAGLALSRTQQIALPNGPQTEWIETVSLLLETVRTASQYSIGIQQSDTADGGDTKAALLLLAEGDPPSVEEGTLAATTAFLAARRGNLVPNVASAR